MKILVCNSRSSSLKFSLFEADEELLLAEGSIDWTTKQTRLRFRRPGRPEVREELELPERELDQANDRCRPDADIASPGSRGRILVIATNEDLTILRQTDVVRIRRKSKSPKYVEKLTNN